MCSSFNDSERADGALDASPVRRVLWNVRSCEVATIVCPTCGAARHAVCRTLWDRPTTALHRGRTLRYVKMRFALDLTEPHERPVRHRAGPVLSGVGLKTTRTPHAQPWRLPMPELADLISASFLDLAKVVTAHACGLQRTGLDELLFGPDRIQQSIDALTYAMHDRQIRRELLVLSGIHREKAEALAAQERAVRERLRDAERCLKEQRIADLTHAGVLPFPAATDDPRRLARSWLGRYLPHEKEELVRRMAADSGVPPSATVHIRSISQKVTRCIDNGWLLAPVTDPVRELLELDGPAFRERVVADAAQQDARDDALCHPLVLNRWRDQLTESLTKAAPRADNPHIRHLHDLTLTRRPRNATQLGRLHGHRRLFAALLQRRAESIRLITTLNDGMSLAERRDPSYELLKKTGDHAYDELVRRHPDLYRHIRTRLARYESRYGRLELTVPRGQLRARIYDELDRMRPARPVSPAHG
ncbi:MULTISPECIES: hypothetical protein [Streptomyces]|uniref:hypothetical protein n=1 Tax=Streptomyces TaxID=1883 RepID=UPI00240DA718|nr:MULTISPECIES: hypothetical protein [Streptomyces]WFB83814.1 hypothetical protein MMU79_11130 [Streptomyces olivaceus]WGK50566.1 hypothetical protein M6G09_35870 [Streptomyces sp. B146]